LKETCKKLVYKDRKITREIIINLKGTRMVKDGEDICMLVRLKLRFLFFEVCSGKTR